MERPNRFPWRRVRAALLLALCTAALVCPRPAVAATAPTISAINDATTNEDTLFTTGFTIGDAESSASSLNVDGSSSNPSLVPDANITFTGNGANRTVRVRPATNQFGSVTITIRVDDGSLTNSENFLLTFNPVNDPPTISAINNRIINEDSSTTAILFMVDDVETPAGSLTLSGSSSVSALVGPGGFVFGGSDESRTVTITPAPNENAPSGSTITITVSDGTDTASETFTLTVNAVPDQPSITGTIGGANNAISDRVAAALFAPLTANDPDHQRPNNETVTITGSLSSGATQFGTFGSGDQLTASGNPAQATTRLRTNEFIPTPNRVPVGQTNSFALSLSISDGSTAPVNNNYTIFIFSENDLPTANVTVSPDSILDTQDVLPFSANLADPDIGDENALTLAIEPINDTNFVFGTLEPARPSFSGSKSFIESAIRAVRFRAVRNASATNVIVKFRFRVTDPHGGVALVTNQITVVAANEPPDIVGVSTTTFRITDDPGAPPIRPFNTVSIIDLDEGGQQQVTVTLAIDDPAKGFFDPTNRYSGTPDFVTEQLRQTRFVARQRPNRVVGETVTAALGITAVDSANGTRTDSNTRVAITSVNGAPVFTGFPTNQPLLIPPAARVNPFLGIAVTDDDTNATTLTITLDNTAKGVLTNLGAFQAIAPGTYRLVTNATAASIALTNLQFAVSSTFLFPPNAPGGTTFTLEAVDSVLNTTRRTLSILLQFQPRNHFVTRVEDDLQPGSLRYALTNAGNNDTITFAFADYPALLRLDRNRGPISIRRNVTIKGPGADLLTISGDSDGNLQPDTQIFRVYAGVAIEGVTLSRGSGMRGETEGTGGAIYVGLNGSLLLRFCAVTDSMAMQWGGAIDVDQGALAVESCLFRDNGNDTALGLGGGAISLYTDQPCSFVNTTFARNRQRANSGFGGGAIYVENYTPSTELPVAMANCTFAENEDAADLGSSLHANVFGTVVTVRNTIFNDNSGQALEVSGSGRIVSAGGNISDDATRATLTQGGQPQSIVILNQATDATTTDPLLGAHDVLLKPTAAYGLRAGSPAIGRAVSGGPAADQRGVIRDNDPDSGAVEFSTFARVVINEVHFAPASGEQDFVELYVPRDSTPVNLGGYSLFIDGIERHAFSNAVVQPGFGVIVADAVIAAAGTRVEVPVAPLALTNRGTLEIRKSGIGGKAIASRSFNGTWADPNSPTQNLAFANNSLTLAPQFVGFAFLPSSLVLPPPLGGADQARNVAANRISPGTDTAPTPFGSPNAFPLAVPDALIVSEDNLTTVFALANDLDADGLDRLVAVHVSQGTNAGTIGTATAATLRGALVTILPTNAPLRGSAIAYDPRGTEAIQQLPAGAELTDSFHYQVLDVGTGAIESYAGTEGAAPLVIVSAGHRLTNGTVIVIEGAAHAAFNGEHVVTRVDDDSFSIPAVFTAASAPFGSWHTKETRTPSAPSEAKVTLTIIGANDAPTPGLDVVSMDEETLLRIMGDANLAGSSTVFATDTSYPARPVISPVALLPNDDDIDTDDSAATLRVVGVAGSVKAIAGYSGTPGVTPVTVESPNHGLAAGTTILISGYRGHARYNGFHVVSVVDSNRFTIPVLYADNAPTAGVWAVLNDANRYQATSLYGAAVTLEIRADRIETSLVYNPRASAFLNGLALGETTNDVFFYAVEDSRGAVSFGQVTVQVAGVNDAPMPTADPGSLASLVGPGQSLGQVVTQLNVNYFLPPASGTANQVDASIQFSGQTFGIANLWTTDEETSLPLSAASLLGNDTDADRSDVLTIESVSALSWQGAALTLGAGGTTVTYDPSASASLNRLARKETIVDSFAVTITDSRGGSVTTIVAVLVVGVNDSPVARDDSSSTPEDVVLAFNPIYFPTNNPALFDLDVDVNGSAPDNTTNLLPVANLTTPGGALVNISSNGIVYDPSVSTFLDGLREGATFVDAFDYSITDSSMLFANDDHFKVAADSAGNRLEVLANDRNLNVLGSSFRITAAGTPSHGGTATVSGGTNVIYTPEVNFVGTEVFTYTIMDERGNIDTAVVAVRVTLNPLNGNLFAGADHFSVAKGEAPLLHVLANDSALPAPASALMITRLINAPASDSVAVENNRLRYTQTASGPFPYTTTLRYEIFGGGTARATGEVTVVVVNREGTLDVRNDAFSIASGVQAAALDVLANDNIVAGVNTPLTIHGIVGAPAHGTAVLNGVRDAVLYTPTSGFVGQDSFTYVATDGFGGTGTGVVSVVIGSLTTSGDFFVVPFDTAAETSDNGATELDVLANDGVIGAGAETITIIGVTPTSTALGTMSIRADGRRLLFNPAEEEEGEWEFTYTIRDGSANTTAQGKVTVVVARAGLNANPDYVAVLANSSGNAIHVLGNDVAIPNQGRPLTIVGLASAPSHGGSVVLNESNDRLLYTPAPGFAGEETFTYTMTDSRRTDTAAVVVRVTAGALLASDDAFTVFFETNANGTARQFTLPVLANDRALPDQGQLLSITGVGIDDVNATNAPNQQGVVSISSDGASLLYTPNDFDGPFPYVERFTYEITDGTARRAEGVVVIEVQQRLNARDLGTHDDAFAVAANSFNNALPLLANDNVKPAPVTGWTIASVSAPAFGAVTISGQSVLYTPQTGFLGTDEFTYSVADGAGGTGSATVRVKVGDYSACGDVFVALSGSVSNAFDVLLNDRAMPVGRSLALVAAGSASHGGSVSVDGARVFYTPDPDFTANHPGATYPYVETFLYAVADDAGGTFTGRASVQVFAAGSDRSTAKISITVVGVNDAPVIAGAAKTAPITDKQKIAPFPNVLVSDVDDHGDQPLTVAVALDDPAKGVLTDLSGFSLASPGVYVMSGSPSNITVAIRELLFVPTENRITVPTTEETLFTITAFDGWVTVTNRETAVPVIAVNDPPSLAGTVSGLRVLATGTIRPFYKVRIADVDDLTLQPMSVHVTLSAAQNGFFSALGGFSVLVPGTYVLKNATPAQATAALRGLVFHPAPGPRVSESVNETTRLTLTVHDGFAPQLVDTNTTVTAFDDFRLRSFASDRSAGGRSPKQFGTAVAASRNFVVAGAPVDELAHNAGAAYVFARHLDGSEQWSEVQKLLAPDGTAGDRLGSAAAISGNVLALGAPRDDVRGSGSGSVYLFQQHLAATNQWGFLLKVAPADGGSSHMFGAALAMDGATLVVGAPGAGGGAAYVFGRHVGGANAWGLVQRLGASDPMNGDEFGFAVAIHGPTLVVGARRNDDFGVGSGSAYVFTRTASNTWAQVKKLLPATGAGGAQFGYAVDVHGDTAMIGEPFRNIAGADSGAAYVFERHQGGANNWGHVKRIAPTNHAAGDGFGTSVAVERDRIIGASPFRNEVGTSSGAVFVFERHAGGSNQWAQTTKYLPDPGTQTSFGTSVALRQNTLAAGAPFDANLDTGTKFGTVYIYRYKFNNAPMLVSPIADQIANVNEPFNFSLAAGTFADPDLPEWLTLGAASTNGAPLPAWLHFNAAQALFSGTSLVANAGAFAVTVTATDDDGESASDEFVIEVRAGALAAWRAAQFGADANDPAKELTVWGDLVDRDGDGLVNLAEYALGLNPNASDAPGGVTIARLPSGKLAVTHQRRTDDAMLVYTLEGSVDFSAWTNAAALVEAETTSTAGANVVRVKLELNGPATQSGLRYFRVKITRAP